MVDGVRTLSNSGSGDVTAPLRAVKLGLGDGAPGASTSGCDARILPASRAAPWLCCDAALARSKPRPSMRLRRARPGWLS